MTANQRVHSRVRLAAIALICGIWVALLFTACSRSPTTRDPIDFNSDTTLQIDPRIGEDSETAYKLLGKKNGIFTVEGSPVVRVHAEEVFSLDRDVFVVLASCRSLRQLSFTACWNLQTDYLRMLESNEHIEYIGLEYSIIPHLKPYLEAIAGYKSLRRLRLEQPNLHMSREEAAVLLNCAKITDLVFHFLVVSDEAIEPIGQMQSLERLELVQAGISDVGVGHLAKLKLHSLDLSGNMELTDESMKAIGKMKTLKTLTISDAKITDVGIAHLAKLQLEQINLRCLPAVTDKAMEQIGQMRSLRSLHLFLTGVSNVGVVHLEKSKVTDLAIAGGKGRVTDDCMISLCNMKELTELSLNDTDVSDASVETLLRLTRLRALRLEHTRLTSNGLQRLRAGLPNCRIEWR